MQFSTPTTQAQMYEILQEIFYYYRVKRESFSGVELQELELERLVFTPLTDAELLEKAQEINWAKQQEFKSNYLAEINKELTAINTKLDALASAFEEQEQKINLEFDEGTARLNEIIVKNGLAGSTIVVDKAFELEAKRIDTLTEMQQQYQLDLSDLNARRTSLVEKQSQAESYCSLIAQKENQATKKELKDEQDKIEREVFRYNNGLDEKEKRYSNENKKAIANLELKFLDIRSGEFTKDQLIEMGYYQDVIDCVCSYYDSLPALTAAQEVKKDTKIIQYLDEYYDSLLYLYQQRAL